MIDKIDKILGVSLIFLAGFLSCLLIFSGVFYNFENPSMNFGFNLGSGELEAPQDWIKENQLHVYDDSIVIDVKDASLSRYAPTGSMKPVLDENSTGIRIVPENPQKIDVGDIITFERDNELIIHRVVEEGNDEQGAWFVTKGDNNSSSDEKIRFKDIKYVTIGILW